MRILAEESIAVVVDVQERLFPHIHDAESLTRRLQVFIRGMHILGIPLVVTQQYTRGLGPTIASLAGVIGDFTPVEKTAFSCCGEPGFMDSLRDAAAPSESSQSRTRVLLVGIESHVCVLQTAIDLAPAGYTPVIVSDCVSSRSPHDRDIALRRLEREGAILTTCESILFELTRVAGSDTFKRISALVK